MPSKRIDCGLKFIFLEVMAHYKGAASEGNRAVTLLKKREQAREEFEFMKKRISEVGYNHRYYLWYNYISAQV